MCGLQFCFMLCFKHSTAAISLCEGILNKLNTLMPKIQPELMKIMNGWSPRIKYNDNIRKKLTLKLRNALKQNKIKVLSMNMEEEDFYGKQTTYFIYKRTLDYYENMNIEFEIIPMKKTWWLGRRFVVQTSPPAIRVTVFLFCIGRDEPATASVLLYISTR